MLRRHDGDAAEKSIISAAGIMPCGTADVGARRQTRRYAMDVKEAVGLAKRHVADLFAQEGVTNLGLEEVEYDDARAQWRITLGFSRPWDRPAPLAAIAGWADGVMKRTYKIVIIDEAGKVLAVRNRETADAA
jgi:hypothetical protein